MTKPYNNVPMSEGMAERAAQQDTFWSGPKLVGLAFATLALCFGLLWAMAEGIIGPDQHEADWGHETHMLQPGVGPLD